MHTTQNLTPAQQAEIDTYQREIVSVNRSLQNARNEVETAFYQTRLITLTAERRAKLVAFAAQVVKS